LFYLVPILTTIPPALFQYGKQHPRLLSIKNYWRSITNKAMMQKSII